MRKIKFRGKALTTVLGICEEGDWAHGYFVSSDDGYRAYIIGPVVEENSDEFWPAFWVPVNSDTVGQFVGLQDMHGKELYEGDIVQVFDTEFKGSFKGVIKFGDGSFYIDGLNGITNYRWQDYEVELMGNIYDNPCHWRWLCDAGSKA